MTDNANDPMFQDFPEITPEEWLEKFKADLKGKDPSKFTWKTQEGLEIKPLYFHKDLESLQKTQQLSARPGEFPFTRGAKQTSTMIRQSIHCDSIAQANELTGNLSKRGANSFEYLSFLDLNNSKARRFGLPINTKEDLSLLFEGIDLNGIDIHFRSGPLAGFMAQNLLQHKQLDVSGSVDLNPVGDFARFGSLSTSFEKQMEMVAGLCHTNLEKNSKLKLLHAGGEVFRESGADIALETACVLATAQEYIESLKTKNFSVDQIASLFHFSFTIGSSYFFEIARLRAFRLLWSNILEIHGLKDKNLALTQINGRGNYFYKTRYDAHTNILRNTTQTMSAIIGGCDSFTGTGLHSLDDFWAHDEFSERIARNTQLVLQHESYLNRVADPAGGSWYIEAMTNELGGAIWKEFQWIESSGGIIDILDSGALHDKIKKSKEKKKKKVSQKSILILGTNQYPNAQERLKSAPTALQGDQLVLPEKETPWSDFFDRKNPSIDVFLSALIVGSKKPSLPLEPFRLSQDFETLRIQVESDFAKIKMPRVFLYTYGNVVARRARAAFSANFFGCIGYEIEDSIGFETIEEGLEALNEISFDFLILCASDKDYEDNAAFLCEKIKHQLPQSRIIIAGNPTNLSQCIGAGALSNIHARSDVLEELKKYHGMLLDR